MVVLLLVETVVLVDNVVANVVVLDVSKDVSVLVLNVVVVAVLVLKVVTVVVVVL